MPKEAARLGEVCPYQFTVSEVVGSDPVTLVPHNPAPLCSQLIGTIITSEYRAPLETLITYRGRFKGLVVSLNSLEILHFRPCRPFALTRRVMVRLIGNPIGGIGNQVVARIHEISSALTVVSVIDRYSRLFVVGLHLFPPSWRCSRSCRVM